MTAPEFGGVTYDQARDYERLSSMLGRVRALMADGQWRTLGQIAAVVGGSEAAISARLRDLRKAKYGAHVVERRSVGGGLWIYRVLPDDHEVTHV